MNEEDRAVFVRKRPQRDAEPQMIIEVKARAWFFDAGGYEARTARIDVKVFGTIDIGSRVATASNSAGVTHRLIPPWTVSQIDAPRSYCGRHVPAPRKVGAWSSVTCKACLRYASE